MSVNRVCAIIAAYNASSTIAASIRSALAEPEVAEVVVIDDASRDDTIGVAHAADDGSGRMKIVALKQNRGPSHARNVAIAESSAPWISVLDADDTFLPGRFARLFAHQDWEMAADNIVFVPEENADQTEALAPPSFDPAPEVMSLAQFIEGNIDGSGGARSEAGFLKPVISRDFLDREGLRYAEDVRLGEDFVLYSRLLSRGARFVTIRSCGYRALERPHSLSGRHRTADLLAFADASRAILAEETLPDDARDALIRHERLTRDKYRHRRFLDRKAQDGWSDAAAYAFQGWDHLSAIARLTFKDKWGSLRERIGPTPDEPDIAPIRFLMEGSPVSGAEARRS